MAANSFRNDVILTFLVLLYIIVSITKPPKPIFILDTKYSHVSAIKDPWSLITFNQSQDHTFAHSSVQLKHVPTNYQVYTTVTSAYKAQHPTWVPHQKRILSKPVTTLLQVLLLMQAGDLEMNPGPFKPKYPCDICSKAVKWGQQALKCDDCDVWIHKDCMGMSSHVYQSLVNSSVTWICCQCGMPNFNSSLFMSSLSDLDTSNSFAMDNADIDPLATSSPKKVPQTADLPPQTSKTPQLRIATANCCSVKVKSAVIHHMLDSMDPDVFIATETKLDPSINSCKLFTPTQSTGMIETFMVVVHVLQLNTIWSHHWCILPPSQLTGFHSL